LAILLIAAGTFAAAYFLEWPLLVAYLISVNTLTFLMYGFDKRQSIKQGPRVPELILHLLALVGGSPAALVGQLTFRHKTRKQPFKAIFIAIIVLQVTAIGLYYYFTVFKSS
jgi:uncharacterized membrane protein YsdA (DUF1294 family)